MHPLRNAATLYAHLKAKLLEAHPEIAEDDETLLGTLEGETDVDKLIAWVVRSALEDKMLSTALGHRIAEMKSRAERIAERERTKRALVAQVMAEIGLKKITADDFTVSQRYTNPSVVITDEATLAPQFWREKIVRDPDKTKIKQYIDDGMTVAGATLSNPQPMIQVRTS